jgi:hypothetical protein
VESGRDDHHSLLHPPNPYRAETPPRGRPEEPSRTQEVTTGKSLTSLNNNSLLRLRFETLRPSEKRPTEPSRELFDHIRPAYGSMTDLRSPDVWRDHGVSATLIRQPERIPYRYKPDSLEEMLRPANSRMKDQERVCRHLYSFLSLQEVNLLQSLLPLADKQLIAKSQPFKDPFCLRRLYQVSCNHIPGFESC